jgi:hypothetical protein
MKRSSVLRVLLIDDDIEVLKKIKGFLERERDISVDGLTTTIEAVAIPVQMEQMVGSSQYRIQMQTIIDFAKACSDKFDYILSDFAFIADKDLNKKLRDLLNAAPRPLTQDDFTNHAVLQLKDIQSRYEALAERSGDSYIDLQNQDSRLDSSLSKNMRRHFFGHKGPVVIYTNSPKPFSVHFEKNEIPAREVEIKAVFAESTQELPVIIPIHEEFGMADMNELDGATLDTYRTAYLAQRIGDELKIIALKRMVHQQRFLRFRRTRRSYLELTAIGIGIGTGVAIIGEILVQCTLTISRDVGIAIATRQVPADMFGAFFAGITTLIIGTYFIPKIGVHLTRKLESKTDDLLGPGEQS